MVKSNQRPNSRQSKKPLGDNPRWYHSLALAYRFTSRAIQAYDGDVREALVELRTYIVQLSKSSDPQLLKYNMEIVKQSFNKIWKLVEYSRNIGYLYIKTIRSRLNDVQRMVNTMGDMYDSNKEPI